MRFGPLIQLDELREHADELTLVDCRFALGRPGAGKAAYLAGHIPGAAFLDLDRDLAAPPGERGRHPLPNAEDFTAAACRAGIRRTRSVVAYDEAGEGGAARLWWLLRHFGHDDAAVLDGGLKAWRAAGGELEAGMREIERGDFAPSGRRDDTATVEELLARGGAPAASTESALPVLLDARAPERFRGEREPIDPVAGHIPGARNLPFAELAPGGRFLSPEQLRARFAASGVETDTDAVAYCGSGVTASVLVLAAVAAGLGPPRLYAGSWSEWSRRGLPAQRG